LRIGRKKAQKAQSGKAATKGIEPRISRISRIKTLHFAFFISPIRVIRAIRGKIFAKRGDSDILQHIKRIPVMRFLRFLAAKVRCHLNQPFFAMPGQKLIFLASLTFINLH
jgi:hypothetical protein